VTCWRNDGVPRTFSYTEKVDVPGAVTNTSSGHDDPQNNYVTGQTGTKDVTKRLAVPTTASKRGGGGSTCTRSLTKRT
jgi:hypothetical protein